MKILLLNPPSRDGTVMVKEGRCMQRKGAWGYVMAPITLVTTATLLRASGHAATVMDCPADGTSIDDAVASVRRLSPDLVLLNTSTPTIESDLAAADAVQAGVASRPTIVAIGIHPSVRPADLLGPGSAVSACIVGEPEYTARDLAATLERGGDLREVAGLALRDSAARVAHTPLRPPISDLDALPHPDWSLVELGNYRLPLSGRRFLLVNTNRGCPFRCTFCNAHVYYGRTPRRHSVAYVVQELRRGVERFGVNDFLFWTEEFLLDRAFVLELCHAIAKADLRIRWVCNGRVDCVDREVLTALRRAGCWNVAFGIESGDREVLAGIRKGITPDQIRQAVALAREAGLRVTGHVIVGLPQDTLASISATARFVDELDLDFVQYYCAIPYPGSDLFEEACANGWITNTDWQRWEHNQSVLSYPHLSSKAIMGMRRRLMWRWYARPRKIASTLRNHVRTPSEGIAFLRSLVGFLRWM